MTGYFLTFIIADSNIIFASDPTVLLFLNVFPHTGKCDKSVDTNVLYRSTHIYFHSHSQIKKCVWIYIKCGNVSKTIVSLWLDLHFIKIYVVLIDPSLM